MVGGWRGVDWARAMSVAAVRVSSLRSLAKLLAGEGVFPLLWGPQEATRTASPYREPWDCPSPSCPASACGPITPTLLKK